MCFAHASSGTPGGLWHWWREAGARGLLLKRGSSSGELPLARGEWGFHRGSHHTPLPAQPGEHECSEMSPAVGLLPPRHLFPGTGGGPRQCPSAPRGPPTPGVPLSPGSILQPLWSRLSPVRETCRQLRGWKAGFLQPGAGSSSCASWKVTCNLRNPCVRRWLFFFCGLIAQALLALRKEEPR